jgi:hypothetical protein
MSRMKNVVQISNKNAVNLGEMKRNEEKTRIRTMNWLNIYGPWVSKFSAEYLPAFGLGVEEEE